MPARKGDWSKFYSITGKHPPSDTLLKALQLFEAESTLSGALAIDLGCGAGRDTIELLRRHWRVLAVDGNEEAVQVVKRKVGSVDERTIRFKVARFESLDMPRCVLVNAAYSLPFCRPVAFPKVWKRISHALRDGGRFSGQLFGVHDEWATDRDMNFHTQQEVLSLFSHFKMEFFKEVDEDGKTSDGTPKHWHVFHIVARTQPS